MRLNFAITACCLFLIACKAEKEAAHVPCDAGRDARAQWLTAPNALRADNATPESLGFRGGGSCVEAIREKRLGCGPDDLDGDNPYLLQAVGLGFTSYVCEGPDGERGYALDEIITKPKPAPTPDPVKPGSKEIQERQSLLFRINKVLADEARELGDPVVPRFELDDENRVVFDVPGCTEATLKRMPLALVNKLLGGHVREVSCKGVKYAPVEVRPR